MPVLSVVILVLLGATASFGIVVLLRWIARRPAGSSFPTAIVVCHVTAQATTIVLWAVVVATGSTVLSWVAFGVVTVGQLLGDQLMLASFRARRGPVEKGLYGAAAKDVLGFRRPVAALHAIVGAVAWFTMLATCIVATVR